MNLSSVALPSVGEKTATIFVALELSKSAWLVALHSPAADKISLHRLQGGDTEWAVALPGQLSPSVHHRTEEPSPVAIRSFKRQDCAKPRWAMA